MPSWSNPAPNGWGRGMPTYIGPGPGNPLGLRALNWNTLDGVDTAIRFHGTQAVGQLGRPASHGCVRLRNSDVIELFDLIDEGATIISVRA
jgi:lipoprotein-anchoring transpeptidase ErfK/SrfK